MAVVANTKKTIVGWRKMVAQIAKTERKHAMAPTTAAQEKRLRVLIPYDGSETAEATLNDLSEAALPPELDALITVTQVCLPSSPYEITRAVSARRLKLPFLTLEAMEQKSVPEAVIHKP